MKIKDEFGEGISIQIPHQESLKNNRTTFLIGCGIPGL
jgi:hypothetical protein